MRKTKNKINIFKEKFILQLNAGGRKRNRSFRDEYPCSILELRLKTFRWHLSIEPLSVIAVVVDHVVVSDPLHLIQLGIAQLAIGGRCPPVRWGLGSTLIYANWSIPLASPCPKIAVSCYEGCHCPINLNSPTLSCPVISIPQAGVDPHSLFVWVSNPLIFIVTVYADWYIINVPPELQ
jgi:hypothetical protein